MPPFRRSFSPYARISQVPIEDIRDTLWALFKQWGLPKSIRTDNGEPFGVPTRDVVPFMSLFLMAWGITPILNRPKRPTDNAHVERAQGTTSRWAEIEKAQNAQDLQKKLNKVIQEQRDEYTVKRLKRATRKTVFPDLYTNSRTFIPPKNSDDLNAFVPNIENPFDIQKAYEFLATKPLERKVSAYGAISLYSKHFQAHFKVKGQKVLLKFNPNSINWEVFDDKGNIIKTFHDERFSKENILSLKAMSMN
jgi:transposase InsO family protein